MSSSPKSILQVQPVPAKPSADRQLRFDAPQRPPRPFIAAALGDGREPPRQ